MFLDKDDKDDEEDEFHENNLIKITKTSSSTVKLYKNNCEMRSNDASISYFKNGLFHRRNGPAYQNKRIKIWLLNGTICKSEYLE